MQTKFAAVLPAGGLGKRMGARIPKQLMLLCGKPVYRYSLETFLKMNEISQVVMSVPVEWKSHFENELFNSCDNLKELITKKLKIVVGGSERWLSVKNGVNALDSDIDYVLVHDVARPFVSENIIRNVCATLLDKGSCIVAKPATDTIKIALDGKVKNTIDRNTVWLAQTPQAVAVNTLKKLYAKIENAPLNFTPTDEASILEYFGESVYLVQGDALNDKLTTPEDFKKFSEINK